MRLYNVRARQSLYGREYTGAAANPRVYAHTMADDLHQSQMNLRGVARTKLAFVSDRNREPVAATVEKRDVKEIYIADYDGANQRRITINRNLNINPNWSPDGRSIAYTSYRIRTSRYPDLEHLRRHDGESDQRGGTELPANVLTRRHADRVPVHARRQQRDLRDEPRWVGRAAVDEQSGHRRVADVVADRNADRVYLRTDRHAADLHHQRRWLGDVRRSSESYADRATWSPAPFNEIAFTARTGPGFDIKILNIASGETRQITFGEGTNESPVWAPNGRHLAFMSTRQGRSQIFTVDRDGRNLRQVTRDGNNTTPHWSQ